VATSPTRPSPARFLDHGGQRVILLDFTGITDTAEGLAALEEARAFIDRLVPDGSHYTLTDVRQTRYDRVIVEAFNRFTAQNKPFIRAAAVVTDSALHRAAITMVGLVSRRKLGVFDTREAGLAYLAGQRAAVAAAPMPPGR